MRTNQANRRKYPLTAIVSRAILWSFLLTVALFTIFPVVMAVLGAFKTNSELTLGATILPNSWEFGNFATAWREANFARFTWNSIFISMVTTVATLVVTSMAAYAVDRRDFPGKKLYTGLQAATLFVSIGAVVLRPQFDLMVKLNLHQSLWGVIIILISGHAMIYFILIGFFKGIPRDLDEAAMIDGCNFFYIYVRIILPLLAPALGVAALFTFRHAWNEYILPLVFTMNQPHLQTLTVGLAGLRYGISAAVENHLMMAGACLSIIPMLIVYFVANKAFMQVNAGSVKG
ncbi:carbohydrate ABC transporter permease [Paenibacillus alkalitolerans]|uniref:carbohydrate ABC transporter permease n=1 Tax=Paenibacillus alkalitolerans TaxID=2799335 RepID=UPI0018F605CA|nr:carbohydrate ABC transporter permease [Paenibacillus alkalitolerans]